MHLKFENSIAKIALLQNRRYSENGDLPVPFASWFPLDIPASHESVHTNLKTMTSLICWQFRAGKRSQFRSCKRMIRIHGKGSTNPGAAPILQAPIIPLCAVCPHQPISNAWLFKPSQAPLFFYEQIRPSQSLCTVCFRIFSALSPSWPLSAPPGLAVTEDGTNRRGAGRTLAAITRHSGNPATSAPVYGHATCGVVGISKLSTLDLSKYHASGCSLA